MKSEYICKTSITKSVEWHNTKKYILLTFESTYYKLIVASNSMNEYMSRKGPISCKGMLDFVED